jgi:hypothetical protein
VRIIYRLACSVGGLLLVTGCGDVVAVHVFPFPLCRSLALGDSTFIGATAYRATGWPLIAYSSASRPEAFLWSSSAPEIVSVTSRGLLHGNAIGSAVISATAEGLTGSVEMQVTNVGQTATIEPKLVSLGVGDTIFLTAHALDNAGVPIQLAGGQVLFGTDVETDAIAVSDDWPNRGRIVGLARGTTLVTWGVGQRCGVIAASVR